ncbi:MAG TPA: hypothetical protein PKY50_06200 [Candidatus Competibacter sp.]|nr:hypothetical protein [Candidatus Competibacter sp.]
MLTKAKLLIYSFFLYNRAMYKLEQWIVAEYQSARIDGLRAIADAAGVRYQTVQYWLKIECVPVKRIAAVADLTGLRYGDLNPYCVGSYAASTEKNRHVA